MDSLVSLTGAFSLGCVPSLEPALWTWELLPGFPVEKIKGHGHKLSKISWLLKRHPGVSPQDTSASISQLLGLQRHLVPETQQHDTHSPAQHIAQESPHIATESADEDDAGRCHSPQGGCSSCPCKSCDFAGGRRQPGTPAVEAAGCPADRPSAPGSAETPEIENTELQWEPLICWPPPSCIGNT